MDFGVTAGFANLPANMWHTLQQLQQRFEDGFGKCDKRTVKVLYRQAEYQSERTVAGDGLGTGDEAFMMACDLQKEILKRSGAASTYERRCAQYNLAYLYKEHDNEAAELWMRRAIETQRELGSSREDPTTISLFSTLAGWLEKWGDHDGAVQMRRRLAELCAIVDEDTT